MYAWSCPPESGSVETEGRQQDTERHRQLQHAEVRGHLIRELHPPFSLQVGNIKDGEEREKAKHATVCYVLESV